MDNEASSPELSNASVFDRRLHGLRSFFFKRQKRSPALAAARSVLAVVVWLCCCYSAAQSPPPDQFVIIALPDTQFYSQSYPQVFSTNMQWVVNNATAMRIKYVAGLGDIVEDGPTTAEWQNADSAVKLLDQAGIPYGMAIGNHDYDSSAMDTSSRKATDFNKWFGPSRYSAYPWYGASNYPVASNENFYTVVNINGVNYMFLYLEFYPRNAALQWAASVVQANPDKQVIVVTHGYENSDNNRMGTCDISGPATYNIPNDNDGDMMWSKFVSQYSNIIMVLSGHMTNAGRQVDAGINGNLVNQFMSAHYPNDPNGGNGYLRIYTITPSQNRIDVKTYSPYANLYKTDSANQFSVSLSGSPMGTVPGQAQIRGRIRNTSCAAITGATAAYQSTSTSQAGTVTVTSSGYYSAAVTSPGSFAITAAAGGYTSASTTVNVTDGYQVPARFILATAPPDFSITSSPPSQTIAQGSSTSYTSTVSGANGFAGAVALTATGLPTGATPTFTPSSVSGSGTATFSIATTSSTPAGTYPITITGTSGTLQHSVQVTLVVNAALQDFSISLSPTSQSVVQGTSGTYSATITPINGFTDAVNFGVSGLPTGTTDSFNPTSVSGSGSSALNVTTSSSTPAGSYPFVVSGTDPTTRTQHTIQGTLSVMLAPDFSITVSPSQQSVTQGYSASYSGTIAAIGGFSEAVSLGVTGVPSGASASFSPMSVNGSGSFTLVVSTTGSTPIGNYNLTITGTSGTLTHASQVTLSVGALPDFTVAASPNSQTIAQGSSTTFTTNVTAVNGFSGVVSLAVSGLPSGGTSSFNPTSVAGSGVATLTVNTDAINTPAGTYPITITASSGVLQHTTQVSLVVTSAPDFSIATSPSSQTVTQGGSATYSASITPVNGFTSPVTFAVSNLPAGATASFSPTTVNGSGSTALTVNTDPANPPPGTYALTVTASSGALQHTSQVTLVVGGSADFNITASPTSQTVTQGGSTTFSTNIAAVNGFSDTVTLTASGLPTAATASFSPTSVSGTGASTLTVSTDPVNTPAGTYTITITGADGNLQHNAQVTLVVSGTPDFGLTASPSSQSVTQGSSTTYIATISPINGFSGRITLTATGLPAAATANFSPASLSASGNSTLTVTTDGINTPAGTYPITVTATSGALQHTSNISLVVSAAPDFNLTTSPASQGITQGSSTTYTANIAPVNGFSDTVTFSISGLPTGATASFSPTTVNSSGTSTVTVSTDLQNTPASTYTLTITGTDGTLQHTAQTTLVVTAQPDFNLSTSPSSQTVIRGNSTTYTASIAAVNGFSGAVTLNATGLPTGATANFSPANVNGSGNSTMTVNTDPVSTPPGTYTVTISAASGNLQHTQQVSLVVSPQPDFNIGATPSSQTVTQGGSTTYSATITPVSGFIGSVTFAVSGLPTGATSSFNPSSLSTSGSTSLTVNTDPVNTPAGTYPVTITATSGNLQHTAGVTLVVNAALAPNFTLSASPNSQSVTQGGSTSYTASISAVNGFTGTTNLSVSGLPTGATATFNPASLTGSGSSTVNVFTSSSTPAGSYAVSISGNSGNLQHLTQVTLIVNSAASPDFSITPSPTTRTAAQNTFTTYKVSIAPINGFTGAVSFGVTGLPAGVTATFSPTSVTTSGSTTLTIALVGTATPGNYTLNVITTSGSIQHSTPLTLSITGFTLTVSPASQTLTRGSTGTYTLTVNLLNGYSGTLNMSVSGLPTGATATFSPSSLSASGTSTLTVQTLSSTPTGTVTLTLRATNASTNLYHTQTVTLTMK